MPPPPRRVTPTFSPPPLSARRPRALARPLLPFPSPDRCGRARRLEFWVMTHLLPAQNPMAPGSGGGRQSDRRGPCQRQAPAGAQRQEAAGHKPGLPQATAGLAGRADHPRVRGRPTKRRRARGVSCEGALRGQRPRSKGSAETMRLGGRGRLSPHVYPIKSAPLPPRAAAGRRPPGRG